MGKFRPKAVLCFLILVITMTSGYFPSWGSAIIGDCYADEKRDAAERETHSVAQSVMSPFCPGRSLEDCPSSAASELRNKITDMLLTGKTQAQVMDNLYGLYGEQIRATPKSEGFGLVGWYMPLAFLVTGLGILIFWLTRSTTISSQSLKSVQLDPVMQAKIQAELDKGV